MTRTERTETSTTPCYCGQGTFVFFDGERDTFYPGARNSWYEMDVNCKQCLSGLDVAPWIKNTDGQGIRLIKRETPPKLRPTEEDQ